MRDLISGEAELDDDEDDESFDDETGEERRKKPSGQFEDSSEEEEDDDDEEEARKVCTGASINPLVIMLIVRFRSAKASLSTKTKRTAKTRMLKSAEPSESASIATVKKNIN